MDVSFLIPPAQARRWYLRPVFYVPLGIVLFLLLGALIYFGILAAQLREQATTYDLSKLDQMESASVILDRNGKIFGQIYVENRQTVPYDQLPRDLVNAVVSMEDTKFYQHSGYDAMGIIRAAVKNLTAGHVRQGASTVTQQLARNSFQLKERTFRRKLLEVFLSKRIEESLGKQKIMELYLNRIYFGGGLYGAEAAARGYFGKPAKEMSLAECATLAGLIKSPNRLSPWADKNAARDSRNVALGRMRDLGFIDQKQCEEAQGSDLVIGNRENAQGQSYAVDYIRQKVIETVGWDRAMNEGFRIFTTIDSDLQTVAEDSLKARLEAVEKRPDYRHQTFADYAASFKRGRPGPMPEYLQGAVIAVDNQTGGILALVGGRDFEHNQFDRALQARRPAGTAMTPFVFAAAFEKGAYPGTIVSDSALDNRGVMIGGATGILGEWGPESADNRYEGRITAREALSKSKNGATVRLGMTPGVDGVLQLVKNAGVKSPLRPYPATFLGSSEITLAELALAYTIFPNGGTRPGSLRILDRIEEKDGTVWHAQRAPNPQRVVKPETAYEVHSCLVDALEKGTAKAATTEFGLKKMDAGGKTGTAYDFTDVLFAGYDSEITCAVWAGFDKPQRIFRGAFGHDIALPVWVDVMNAALGRYPSKEIAQPADVQRVQICSESGLLATDKCFEKAKDGTEVKTTYAELATSAQRPSEPCDVHGGGRASLTHDLPPSEFPRAALAVDTSAINPVTPKAPVLLAARDPYNSLKGVIVKPADSPTPSPTVPAAASASSEEMPDPTKPVMRAEPVHSSDAAGGGSPLEIRRAIPVRRAIASPSPLPIRRAQPVPSGFY